MAEVIKKGEILFAGNSPMRLADTAAEDISGLTKEQEATIRVLGKTVRAYLTAAKELLAGKYVHLQEFAPHYLTDPGNVMVACCADGAVIRYENKVDSCQVISAWLTENLSQVALMLSQNLIQCHYERQFTSALETTGTEIKLSTFNPTTNETRDLIAAKIGFDAVVEQPTRFPPPPQKPFCLLSVRNTLEIGLVGELIDDQKRDGKGQRFLVRSPLRLPVGWECIEVYPYLNIEYWKAEYASVWAENDILASVLMRQLKEAHYQSLDPQAAARKQYAAILREFKTLLDSEPEREEILQVFLRGHPFLLCPTHTKMWPKLAFGAKTTDFVFRDATSDYLLVELERSTYRIFRSDGHPANELNVARGQITDWKRYLEDNLATVQRELGLAGISSNPRSLIVIGRSRNLSPEHRRKLAAMENEHPKLRIMTYDDVHENAKAVIENLLGPIWDAVGNTQIYYLK
jgi:hypothetical protein